jgi:multisubunit Na+/H+ antiporter MnhC subunit
MNRRFLFAWLAVFIGWMAGSFVVHGTLLYDEYSRLPHLFRSEADSQQHMQWMILAHVIMSGAFVWIYSRGVEATRWPPQGARFGLAVALLTVVPWYLIYYAVQPLPGSLVVKQIVYDAILVVLLGVLVAWMYRTEGQARAARARTAA